MFTNYIKFNSQAYVFGCVIKTLSLASRITRGFRRGLISPNFSANVFRVLTKMKKKQIKSLQKKKNRRKPNEIVEEKCRVTN